jgi:galactose mutarotase-like enzyme
VALELATQNIRVEVLPEAGGRIQRVLDRRSNRELLYQRSPSPHATDDYLAATTGGWDVLFPNDEPWRGHPDHGRVWAEPFTTVLTWASGIELHAVLGDPPVDVTRRIALLDAPRVGVREEVTILARADTDPFLVAPHPMLAVNPGWLIELGDGRRTIAADANFPGRFSPEQSLGEDEWREASVVPASSPVVVEVLYVDGVESGEIASPETSCRTRVVWDAQALPYLWICTIAGLAGHGTFVILEPCTSRPYRLDDAIAAGTAVSLRAGERWSCWTEVESLDRASS